MWPVARKLNLTAAVALIAAATPLFAAGPPHPNHERGFDPGKAWTVYGYAPATATTPARVSVARQNAGSSVKLTEQRMVFDGFGRVCVTQERLLSGTWNRQDTVYWATDWKREESVVYGTGGLPVQ